MAYTWITDLTDFLDEAGDIISGPTKVKTFAEYFSAIVFMVSYPDTDYPAEYSVKCRRRPKRKPCLGEVFGFINPEADDIMWMCPKCHDRGIISNWRGTMWDLSDSDQIAQ
jgi:hypothetical protein